jgi:hypothetical protein
MIKNSGFIKISGYQWRQFQYLWKSNSNEYDFFDLAKKIKTDISFDFFDHGWQYRTVLDKDYEVAKTEFEMILVGCH